MKHYQCRIALRLSTLERQKIEQLILERKFENLSHVIRAALKEFLNAPEANYHE